MCPSSCAPVPARAVAICESWADRIPLPLNSSSMEVKLAGAMSTFWPDAMFAGSVGAVPNELKVVESEFTLAGVNPAFEQFKELAKQIRARADQTAELGALMDEVRAGSSL